MELTFLDGDFVAVSSPIDTAISVVWSLRMQECGTFAVVLPLTEGMVAGYTPAELLNLAHRAVYLRDRQYCGRIETILVQDGLLWLEGRTLECLLYDRVAGEDTVFVGRADEAVAHMLQRWGADLVYQVEEMAPLGESSGYGMEAGENLGRWLHQLLSPLGAVLWAELGADGMAHLSLQVGMDRSLDSEAGVSRAIFSEGFGNIASLEEETHTTELCDRLYVQGGDGTVVMVEKDGTATNPLRRELFRKAADIRPSAYETVTAYEEGLRERGRLLLAQMGIRSRLTCVAEHDTEPRYGVDYALGDICEVHAETLGIRRTARLQGMDVVYESGTVRLYPQFGDDVVRVKTVLGG